jgi:hypothetical protein
VANQIALAEVLDLNDDFVWHAGNEARRAGTRN